MTRFLTGRGLRPPPSLANQKGIIVGGVWARSCMRFGSCRETRDDIALAIVAPAKACFLAPRQRPAEQALGEWRVAVGTAKRHALRDQDIELQDLAPEQAQPHDHGQNFHRFLHHCRAAPIAAFVRRTRAAGGVPHRLRRNVRGGVHGTCGDAPTRGA